MEQDTRAEFLQDVLVTAIEGGINYWSRTYHYQPDYTQAIIRDMGEGDEPGDFFTITAPVLEGTIQKIITRQFDLRDEFIKLVAGASATNDASDIDAEVADVIIQLACFGEVVYS